MSGILQRAKSFFQNKDGVMGLFSTGNVYGDFLWSKNTSLSLYEKSIYASSAIRKRAEKTGEIQFVMKDLKGEILDNNKEAEQWLNLLNKPNDYQTGSQFWELAQKYYDTVGACYIRKVFNAETIFKTGKIPDKLVLLRADQVTPQLNANQTEITGFLYSGNGEAETIKLEEVIYWFRPSMRNPILGESLIGSAATAIESEYQISKYHANVLKNGGKLETILKVKNLTSKKQLEELEESYREKYAQAKQLGRPLFMGGDIESITTALSPTELSYLDTKVSNYRDLAIVTGVPKEILANTDGSTYQNADAAIRIFLREVVANNMKSLTTVIDWRLIPDGMWLDFIDPTPEDKEEKRKDMETADKINALTPNEKREMLGMEALKVPEADAVMIPFNLRPLGELQAETPKPAPTKDPNAKMKSADYHPLRDKSTRELWGKSVDMARKGFDARMKLATKRFFADQKDRVLKSLKTKRKIAVDEVFNDGLEISIAKATLVDVIRQIFMEQGQHVTETFDFPAFSMTMAAEKSLRERADMFTTSIINTQKEKLIKQFKESADLQETRAKLVERIDNLYSDISTKWAEVIARTEVHAAVSGANLEAYKQGGMKIKIWTWGPGVKGGARPEHQAMDGEEVAIDAAFSNGEHAPGEPNCGCTI